MQKATHDTNSPQPTEADYDLIKMKEEESKKKQKALFDSRHRAQDLDPLSPGDVVWIHDHNTSGTVVEETATQSYEVSTPTGSNRRNQHHLTLLPDQSLQAETTSQEIIPGDGVTRTRSS